MVKARLIQQPKPQRLLNLLLSGNVDLLLWALGLWIPGQRWADFSAGHAERRNWNVGVLGDSNLFENFSASVAKGLQCWAVWFHDSDQAAEKFDSQHLYAILFLNVCKSVSNGMERSDQVFAVPKSIQILTATVLRKVDLVVAKKVSIEGKTMTFPQFSQKNFK